MKNLTIAKKLIFLVLTSLIFIAGASGIAISQMRSAQKRFDEVQRDIIPSIILLSETNAYSAAMRSAVRDYIVGGFIEDPVLQKTQRDNLNSLHEKIIKNLDTYRDTYTSKDQRARVEADRQALNNYMKEVNDVFTKVDAKDMAGISTQFAETGPFRVTAMALIKALTDHAVENQKVAGQLKTDGDEEYTTGMYLLGGVGLIALISLSLFSYIVITGIGRSLTAMRAAIDHIEGKLDFTVRAAVLGKDEVAYVAMGLNRLIERLRDSLSKISQNAQAVSSSADHLAQSSSEVAKASAHQSDSAVTMAASVEEMTVNMAHVSNRSDEAHVLSTQSGKHAEEGEAVIHGTVDDITRIADSVKQTYLRIAELEKSSDEISLVTAVIKEVADQTNLLALNAAIEAARAGDQGRGFSVVADEVRKLAERTATSTIQIAMMVDSMRSVTKEVSGYIDATVTLVESGMARATDANLSIRKIREASADTVQMVQEITTAIRKQSHTSTSIASAVESIAQMAEESSASAQNTADSAKLLDTVARDLEQIVKQYTL